MRVQNLCKRLGILEGRSEEEMIEVAHQWLNEDGTPAGERVVRSIPRSRIQPLQKMFDDFGDLE